MAAADAGPYTSFEQISERLDQIIAQVRDKDTSLEQSLDLFDEAIELGSRAVDMVDATDMPPSGSRADAHAEDAGKPGGVPAGDATAPTKDASRED